jgi:hypothetical protein
MGKDRKTCNRYHVGYVSSWIEQPIVKGCRQISIVPYFSRRHAESSIFFQPFPIDVCIREPSSSAIEARSGNIRLLQTTPLSRMDPLAKRMITRVSTPLAMQTEAGGSQRRTSHLDLALKPSSCDAGVPPRLRGASVAMLRAQSPRLFVPNTKTTHLSDENLRVPPTFIPIRM